MSKKSKHADETVTVIQPEPRDPEVSSTEEFGNTGLPADYFQRVEEDAREAAKPREYVFSKGGNDPRATPADVDEDHCVLCRMPLAEGAPPRERVFVAWRDRARQAHIDCAQAKR